LQTDASDYGIGAYLFQVDSVNGTRKELPLGFISKSLDKVQRRWSTIEKEAFAIFYALRKWEYLLQGRHFVLQTDHKNLTFINTDLRQKVTRWKVHVQEFDFDIQYLEGENNTVADNMSRHCQNLGQHDYPTGVERVLTLRAIGVADQDIVRFSSELKEQNNHDVYKMNAREYHDILEETRPNPL
jgi:hypothetical protein